MLKRVFRPLSKGVRVRSIGQSSMFGNPTDVITHTPSIACAFPFHLDAFLYSNPPNLERAAECHRGFCQAISQLTDAKVWKVEEILKRLSSDELIEILLETSAVRFLVEPDVDTKKRSQKMQEAYLKESLSKLSNGHLLDLILLNPKIQINVDNSSTGFSYKSIPVQPLSNLVFTRDQQFATPRGVILGRQGPSQRRPEVNLMKIVLRQLGVPIVAEIERPGILNGGDVFTVNPQLSLIGVSSRTNMVAARQCLENDYFQTNRVVIVESQVSTDTFDSLFNMLTEDLAVCTTSIARDTGMYKRVAHEYIRTEDGHYGKVSSIPFGEWLKKGRINTIEITPEQRRQFFTHFLHLGPDSHGKPRVLTGSPGFAEFVKKNGFSGEVHTIDFSDVMTMDGGPHAASFCLRTDF